MISFISAAKLFRKHFFIPILAICISTFFSCRVIKPDAPSIENTPIPDIPQPISDIDIPIAVDLRPYLAQAESSAATEYKGNDNPCEGIRYNYLFQRSPFTFSGGNNSINLTFEGRYRFSGEYCAKCFNNYCVVPKPGFSCGVGEPMKRIAIAYTSSLKITPDYHLKTTTKLTTLKALDKCMVTFMDLDVTDRILNEIRDKLNGLGSSMDKNISSFDLKPFVKPYWEKIFQEIKIADYGYLNINPKSLRMSTIDFSGTTLTFSIGLSCKPLISSESKQEVTPPPLPDLSISSPPGGFNIYLDLFATYDALNKQINQQLDSQEIKVGNKSIVIKNVVLKGIGNSKLMIKVDFTGSRTGTIFLIGTPAYNPITHVITVPDLSYDIKTKGTLLKIADWLLNDTIASVVREHAYYDLTWLLKTAKTNIETQLNQEIDTNIKMEGSVDDFNVQALYPMSQQLLVRLLINGNLAVMVSDK